MTDTHIYTDSMPLLRPLVAIRVFGKPLKCFEWFFGSAQGLLSLETRGLCVWSLSVTSFSPVCADRRAGEVQFDFGLSVASPKLGDSDQPQQTQSTEEFVVFTMRCLSLMLEGLIPGLILFPGSGLSM